MPGAGGATAAARGWHHELTTLSPQQSLGPRRLHMEDPGARGKARQWIQLSEACQGPGTSPATSPGGHPVLGATGTTGAEDGGRQLPQWWRSQLASQGTSCHPSPRSALLWEHQPPMAPAPRAPQPGPPRRPRKGGAGGDQQSGDQGRADSGHCHGSQARAHSITAPPTAVRKCTRGLQGHPAKAACFRYRSFHSQNSQLLKLAWTGKLFPF